MDNWVESEAASKITSARIVLNGGVGFRDNMACSSSISYILMFISPVYSTLFSLCLLHDGNEIWIQLFLAEPKLGISE